ERGLTPSPLVLRSAEEGLISIVNTNKEGENQRDLKVISREHFIRGILNSKSNDAKGIKSSKLKVWGDLKWDGLIYNPRG
ncbi:serine protease, partial [Streptococcus pneumoniae]|nr:serine protease [Streptococcus pneumoniae]